MPNPVPPTNPDGSLRAYDAGEIDLMAIEHVGVRDGAHPTIVRRVSESTYTAEYFCAYEELESFICHMLGAAKIYVNSGSDRLSRLIPRPYPGKSRTFAVGLDEAVGH